MPPQHSICLIICYFGRQPAWIHLFLASCVANPTINFLIFTDCIPTDLACANVRIKTCRLEDIQKLASEKLGMKAVINTPYKLCDFKPAYASMFSSYLADYDFWGMTDLDVIFGDIRSFVTDELLAGFDVINGHTDYIVGHFSLYRNTEPVRNLYSQSQDFERVARSAYMFSFAECGRQWHDFALKKNTANQPKSPANSIDSMTHVVNRLADRGELRVHYAPFVREKQDLNKKTWLLHWDNGQLIDIDAGEEIMYFHFHLFKQSKIFHIPNWHPVPTAFYINGHGFFV